MYTFPYLPVCWRAWHGLKAPDFDENSMSMTKQLTVGNAEQVISVT